MPLRYSPCTGGGLPAPPSCKVGSAPDLAAPPLYYLNSMSKIFRGGLQGQKSMAQWLGGGAARSVALRTLQEGGAGSRPPVQGEYLNSTFDFLDDVWIFEKILQGPERYRIGKPCKYRIGKACKVQSATLPNPKLLIATWERETLHPDWDWVNQK